jgi:urea transporter
MYWTTTTTTLRLHPSRYGIFTAFYCGCCGNDKERSKLVGYYLLGCLLVVNMPQLCATAYGCLEGMWLPTLGYCCLSSIIYIVDSHYLDMISNNAVIINVHLCSHLEHYLMLCITLIYLCLVNECVSRTFLHHVTSRVYVGLCGSIESSGM